MTLNSELASLQKRLQQLDRERAEIVLQMQNIQKAIVRQQYQSVPCPKSSLTPLEKIRLFKSIFIAREDVYARRFEGNDLYKGGYTPVCTNEWIPGVCQKKNIKCH